MATDKINVNTVDSDGINGVAGKYLDRLNEEQWNIVLEASNDAERQKREGGKIGQWLGTNTKNASIHIAMIVSMALLIICVIDLVHSFFPEQAISSKVWDLAFPVITLALGYIFGKGESK